MCAAVIMVRSVGISPLTPAAPMGERPSPRAAGDRGRSTSRIPIAAILAFYLALALLYDASTPILEASDELHHFAVVQQVASGKGLPVLGAQTGALDVGPRQEAGQAPLYYLLAGALTAPVRAPTPGAAMQVNPHSFIGQPSWRPYNENILIHTDAERFPYRGLALAVHMGRWLSIALGAVTILVAYLLGRELFPLTPAVGTLGAALVAFNPMVLFIAASVDNDALAMATCSTATYLLVAGWRRSCSWRWVVALGVALGFAAMSKLSALGLALAVALVLLHEGWKRRSARWAVLAGAAVGALAAALAGWWYVRNWALYGELTGLSAFLDVAGRRPPNAPADLLAELPGLWTAYWGVFGAFDILAPGWLYRAYSVVGLAAAAGVALGLATMARGGFWRQAGAALWVPALWILLEGVALVRWTTLTMASSGRLLYPAIASLTVLAAAGLLTWTPRRWKVWVAAALSVLLAGAAALVPVVSIRPAYAAPRSLAPSAVPVGLAAAGTQYGESLTLLGASWPSSPVRPGETLPVSLYWQARGASTVDYSASIQLVGGGGQKSGQLDMLLGSGMRGTSRWSAGEIYRDVLPLTVPATVVAPGRLGVRLSVYRWGQPGTLPARTAGGASNELILGDVSIASPAGAAPGVPNPLDADFGGVLALRGYALSGSMVRPGGTLGVSLFWRGEKPTPTNYTVFVHVTDDQNRKAGQHDGQPRDGQRPTSIWRPGELVEDQVDVPIVPDAPAGQYRVVIGVYNLATMQRLLLAGGGDSLDLAIVTVQ